MLESKKTRLENQDGPRPRARTSHGGGSRPSACHRNEPSTAYVSRADSVIRRARLIDARRARVRGRFTTWEHRKAANAPMGSQVDTAAPFDGVARVTHAQRNTACSRLHAPRPKADGGVRSVDVDFIRHEKPMSAGAIRWPRRDIPRRSRSGLGPRRLHLR